jgi:uncharacterized protein YerC
MTKWQRNEVLRLLKNGHSIKYIRKHTGVPPQKLEKFLQNGSNIISLDEQRLVKDLIVQGYSIEAVKHKTNLSYERISSMFLDIRPRANEITQGVIGFGSKQEPYYTEQEMLNGIPQYTYEDLSEDEKILYNAKVPE